MARIPNSLETRQVLDIVQSYMAALVTITIMIAESRLREKEAMTALVMNFLMIDA